MLDIRIYQAGLIPLVGAIIALLFSVQALPNPLPEGIAPASFDTRQTFNVARQIVATSPDRTPGSDGDQAVADFVEERFSAIEGGRVSKQTFSDSYEGEDVELENLILELPGESQNILAVFAGRDSVRGEGAASSAASTAVLLELAAQLGRARRERRVIFVSTDGASDGAKGAREFARAFADVDLIDAAVTIYQPGLRQPRRPFLLDSANTPETPALQLYETARATLSQQLGGSAQEYPSFTTQLSRLAFPGGIGDQSVLISDGIDAVTITSGGERAVSPTNDVVRRLGPENLGRFGRATLALILSLNEARQAPTQGPDQWIVTGTNAIPGWTLQLLGLALILPIAMTAADSASRIGRRTRVLPLAIAWAVSRIGPLLVALLGVYLLSIMGLIPSPDFPFEPARFQAGTNATIALVIVTLAALLTLVAMRPLYPPRKVDAEIAGASLGVVATLSIIGLWLINPYLALLMAPIGHIWLLASLNLRRPLIFAASILALAPVAIAALAVADSLDLGLAAPWPFLLTITSGQIGFLTALLSCALLSTVLGAMSAVGPGGGPGGIDPDGAIPIPGPEPDLPSIRGPGGYAGPGSLGGTQSAR